MSEPCFRVAKSTDNFDEVWPNGEAGLQWDWDQVLVAVDDERVVGVVIMWDAGHPLIYISHFSVVEKHRGTYIGWRLIEAAEAYAKEHGKSALMGFAYDEDYLRAAIRLGAQVYPEDYRFLLWMVR